MTEKEMFFMSMGNRAFPIFEATGLKAVGDSPVAVKGSYGVLHGYKIFTNGTNQATVTFYDNATEASGKIIDKLIVAGADLLGGVIGLDARADNGITMKIEGTGATASAYYI